MSKHCRQHYKEYEYYKKENMCSIQRPSYLLTLDFWKKKEYENVDTNVYFFCLIVSNLYTQHEENLEQYVNSWSKCMQLHLNWSLFFTLIPFDKNNLWYSVIWPSEEWQNEKKSSILIGFHDYWILCRYVYTMWLFSLWNYNDSCLQCSQWFIKCMMYYCL